MFTGGLFPEKGEHCRTELISRYLSSMSGKYVLLWWDWSEHFLPAWRFLSATVTSRWLSRISVSWILTNCSGAPSDYMRTLSERWRLSQKIRSLDSPCNLQNVYKFEFWFAETVFQDGGNKGPTCHKEAFYSQAQEKIIDRLKDLV